MKNRNINGMLCQQTAAQQQIYVFSSYNLEDSFKERVRSKPKPWIMSAGFFQDIYFIMTVSWNGLLLGLYFNSDGALIYSDCK